MIFTRFSPVPPRFQGEKKNPGNVMFPGFACNFNNCSVISWVIPINACLTFGELRSSTCCFETVFLTLFHSRVTCQESCALEHRSVISVCLKESSCDTVTDRTCLSCVTAAFYVYEYVEFICCACSHERLAYNNLQSLKSSMSLLLIVILPVPGTRYTLATDFFLLPVP